jgi:hypothetical protein
MKIFRELRSIPRGEKVVNQFQIETILELTDELYGALRDFFQTLRFTVRANKCKFHITNAGNCVIEGLDEQEMQELYTLAYCSYIVRFDRDNRRESYNGTCHSTREDFIEDCKSDKTYISYFLDRYDFKRYCCLLKHLEVATV